MSTKKNNKNKPHEPKKKAEINSFTIDNKLVLKLSLVIALFAFLIYSNTLKHQFVLDDFSVIKENQLTKGGTASLKEIFSSSYRTGYGNNENNLYRPLTKAMFAIEWQLSPNNPHFHHLINVLMYAFVCVLLFIVLLRYTKINIYILFIIAMLFAAHPIHTEVVANIKSRDEISSMLFLLLSLLSISHYLMNKKMLLLVSSLFCFFLALLSKESAIVYIALAPLFIYFFTETSFKKNLQITGSLAFVGFLYILLHIKIIGSIGIKNIPVIDNSLLYTSDFIQQKATAILIMGKYFLLLLFPQPLSCDYSFNTIPIVSSFANLGFLLALLFHVFLLYFAIKNIKEKHLLSFCILFYLGSMVLASNILMLIGTHLAERLLFFPSIAYCLASVYLVCKLLKIDITEASYKVKSLFNMNSSLLMVIGIVLILFSIKTYSRNKDWKSDTTLFGHDLKTVPNSAHMLFYYANNLANKDSLNAVKNPVEREQRLVTAQKSITKALELYELFPDAHNVAGRIYYEQKNYQAAFKSYSRAMEMNPGKGMYHNNAGTCLFSIGNYEEAAKAFEKAAEIDKFDADARCNLGSAYGAMGEAFKNKNDQENANKMFNLAIDNFKKATIIDPNYKSAYQFIGVTYKNMGDSINGQIFLDKAAKIRS
ncbi:MAG: tetratricopeptide repeat protein [Bacteroidetes bacterium]|nr:tetratricopeptide repeat protein [Bacteroidota bacterium]